MIEKSYKFLYHVETFKMRYFWHSFVQCDEVKRRKGDCLIRQYFSKRSFVLTERISEEMQQQTAVGMHFIQFWCHILIYHVLKFIYSQKATKIFEIFPLLLTSVHTVKSKGKISQNFVAFSEYMNFNQQS